MVLLLVEGILGDEHGEVGVFDSISLDEVIEELGDILPDIVGPGSQNITTGDIVVIEHFRLSDNLSVPLRKVLLLLDGDFEGLLIFLLVLGLFGLFGLSWFLLSSLGQVENSGCSLD